MDSQNKHNPIELFLQHKSLRFRLFWEGIAVGIGTGLIISLFRFVLVSGEALRVQVYDIVLADRMLFIPYVLFFLVTAWLLLRLMKMEPICSGGGVPQVKGLLAGSMSMNWWLALICRFVGCCLSIGAGMSMGRAGPSVHLGACVGKGFSSNRKRSRTEERILITAGAGAGLAAAFSAPLAGVIFCLEELHKTFSPVVLTAAIGASIMAVSICQAFFGFNMMFTIGELERVTVDMLPVFFLMALFVGFWALAFNRGLILSMDIYNNSSFLKGRKPLLPLFLAAVLGFVLPEILGGGNELVDYMVNNPYPMAFLLTVLAGKYLYTMICCGSGVPGGIFLPMLVLGALGGNLFGQLAILIGIMPVEFLPHTIVFGMAAYFAAVAKSPVTAAVLIMEITGSTHYMLTLVMVSMTAYMVADMTGGKPIYEQLLEYSLNKKK